MRKMRKSQTTIKKWARKPNRPNHNLQHKDLVCCNIYCKKPLTEYEFDRQTRSYKYRFCITCRSNNRKKNLAVRWKCLGCDVIMDGTWGIVGRYYCTVYGNRCEGIRKRRSRYANTRNAQIRLAKAIHEAGGLEHYRSKISI